MRLNAIVDNFARSSTNGSISGFEQSERHVPIVLEGEGLPDHGRDLDCIAAESHPLYARLEAFDLDKAGVSFPFTERLARDNMWNATFAARVCCEYRKFLFLACTADHVVTPSEQVDEAWHLHLIYTKSYWGDLCTNVLQRPLHHEPTEGGKDQQAYFRDCYEKTLATYECAFGEKPPADIWPNVNSRFNSAGLRRTVDLNNFWIVRKPGRPTISQVAGGALGLSLLAFGIWGHLSGFDKIGSLVVAATGFIVFMIPFTDRKDWTIGTFKQLHRQFLSWSKRRVMPELDARTQYDIGENDCRPPQAKPTKAYSASFEAMLNRSI